MTSQHQSEHPTQKIRVAAHEHLYPCFNATDALDAAVRVSSQELLVLCLTETQAEDWFVSLDQGGTPEHWQVYPTEETNSKQLVREDGITLWVIAGRQAVSEEGLEVLGLGVPDRLSEQVPAATIIQQVQQAGGIAVLPWGVGKWMGTRGNIAHTLLTQHAGNGLLPGDNGNRPLGWPKPKQFGLARTWLPGADPLPLPAATRRVGGYGMILQTQWDEQRPWASLKQSINALEGPPVLFGKRVGPISFLTQQVAMQLRKRIKAR